MPGVAGGGSAAGAATAGEGPAGKPHLHIRPRTGLAALDLREVLRYRGLLLELTLRDLRLRYKQTALGVAWVFIQPLFAAGILSFVFGTVADLPSDGRPYFLFAFSGMLGWNLFANTLRRSSGSLMGNTHLISKIFFPRLVLPLSTVPSTLVDFAVSGALLAVVMAVYGVAPGGGLWLLPLLMAVLVALATGVGLFASALSVSYRDVQHVLPVFVQLLLYASPVAYSVTAVPEHLRGIYLLNPVASVLGGFRYGLIGTSAPSAPHLAYAAAVSVVVLLAGAVFFKVMERRFADVV